LKKDLRPKIDAVSRDLLAALEGAHPHLRPEHHAYLLERSRERWRGDGISTAVRERALAPIAK
jgi:hypothetical protein